MINTPYEHTIKLLKNSDGEATLKMKLEGKNSEQFDVLIEDTVSNVICDGSSEVECNMDKTHELELKVHLNCSEIGEKKAYFIFHPTDGVKMAF